MVCLLLFLNKKTKKQNVLFQCRARGLFSLSCFHWQIVAWTSCHVACTAVVLAHFATRLFQMNFFVWGCSDTFRKMKGTRILSECNLTLFRQHLATTCCMHVKCTHVCLFRKAVNVVDAVRCRTINIIINAGTKLEEGIGRLRWNTCHFCLDCKWKCEQEEAG